MKKLTILLLSLFATCIGHASEDSPAVAHVLGKDITAEDIDLSYDAHHKAVLPIDEATCLISNPVINLQTKITQAVMRDYLSHRNLKATDDEVRELQDFQDLSMAQDRIRWQKDLETVEHQLKTATLSPKDREQAEKSHAALLRLADFEKRLDTMPKLTAEELRSINAPWIEAWKFNKSVYEQFGGVVALTKFGPDPVEATRRLIEKYEKEGKIKILDTALRTAFWIELNKPPCIKAELSDIDFTPFWKKPPVQNED